MPNTTETVILPPDESQLEIIPNTIIFEDPLENPASQSVPPSTTLGSVVNGASGTTSASALAVRDANTVVLPPGSETGNSWNFFQTVGDAMGSLWNNVMKPVYDKLIGSWLYSPYGGTILIAAAAAAAVLLIYHFMSSGNTSGTTTNGATALSTPAAKISSLDRQLQTVADDAVHAGVNPMTVQTQRNVTEMTYGTPLVIQDVDSSRSLGIHNLVVTKKSGSPAQYVPIASLNVKNYLTSLTAANGGIIENSAVIHGAETQKQ